MFSRSKERLQNEWVNIQLTDLAFLILTMNKYLPVVYLHLLTFIVDFEQREDDL